MEGAGVGGSPTDPPAPARPSRPRIGLVQGPLTGRISRDSVKVARSYPATLAQVVVRGTHPGESAPEASAAGRLWGADGVRWSTAMGRRSFHPRQAARGHPCLTSPRRTSVPTATTTRRVAATRRDASARAGAAGDLPDRRRPDRCAASGIRVGRPRTGAPRSKTDGLMRTLLGQRGAPRIGPGPDRVLLFDEVLGKHPTTSPAG